MPMSEGLKLLAKKPQRNSRLPTVSKNKSKPRKIPIQLARTFCVVHVQVSHHIPLTAVAVLGGSCNG